ncbi:hypothetical protein BDZ90DRAFT_247354 [Jaminaea rosea]|uniref:TLC domain-containing protein n=1 Tax=Jaminaea rosea TaxID=1569628 RepID=A0A316UI79_9BASI|nr:hypothetical protein BDZ90DRAFT_247354 [Jaminaea rosea]PWN24578.1 hypothetical protein BDZ90DRAFT_247354 [Jaminaea rosea]
MATHFPLVLLSLSFWLLLHFGSILLTPAIYPAYKRLPGRTRTQWHVHFVALAHAVIIVPLAAAQWYEVREGGGLKGSSHPLAQNRTYGYTKEAGNVYAVTLGYFIWDLVVSALFDGPAFIAHGAVAMMAFTFVYHPIFMYDGFGFLLWELSTPFLNIHWFMDKCGLTGSSYQLINAFFLLSSYIVARLTFGVYNSYSWFQHVNFPQHPHVPAIPLGLKVFYSVGNVVLNTLNFVWFRAMIAAVLKRFDGSSAKKGEKQDEASRIDRKAEKEAGIGSEARDEVRRRVVGEK